MTLVKYVQRSIPRGGRLSVFEGKGRSAALSALFSFFLLLVFPPLGQTSSSSSCGFFSFFFFLCVFFFFFFFFPFFFFLFFLGGPAVIVFCGERALGDRSPEGDGVRGVGGGLVFE